MEQSPVSEALQEKRLLTEVDHMLAGMRPDGTVDPAVMADVRTNLFTAVQEVSMPAAVTVTAHRVEYDNYDEDPKQRVITWLGKSAVKVAMSGYEYHFSDAAHKRVDVEVAEARHAQEQLAADRAQVFISPRMTRHDADEATAKAEHLHDDDAVRTAFAVTDSSGRVVARRLESLLVRDVPFDAWVTMLKDPGNIFGRSFELHDEQSALSVMELFKDLELSEEELSEGPVTLVAAVAPYITDTNARASVERQLSKFRKDQHEYRYVAERIASKWQEFELELAKSMKEGEATYEIERFIAVHQHQWGDEDMELILQHDVAGRYVMTRQLAATLEQAKQNILFSSAAVVSGNEKVLGQVDNGTGAQLEQKIKFLWAAEDAGASIAEQRRLEAELYRDVAAQNFHVGGGCPGNSVGRFRTTGDSPESEQDEANRAAGADEASDSTKESKSKWKWKKGVCRVEACPSPRPTEVGPCEVCRGCQHEFDAGRDPTKQPILVEMFDMSGLMEGIHEALEEARHRPPAEQESDRDKLVLAA